MQNPNKYKFEKSICKIELYNKNGNVRNYSIIDIDDYSKVNKYRWYQQSQGYVVAKTGKLAKRETIFLHRFLLGLKKNDGFFSDHINRDVLDNRNSNLIKSDAKSNSMNQGVPSNNTSGYKGVHFCARKNKWKAVIGLNYKKIFLGHFKSKEDAALAYNLSAKKYHGEYAFQNKIRDRVK